MKSVAEGVENERQLDLLRTMECDEAQGFLYCEPVSELLLMDYLNQTLGRHFTKRASH